MMGYTNKNAIENYLLVEIDENFDEQINEWIEAMENYITKTTGRIFIAPQEKTAKKYDGNGKDEIWVDEFIELESVKIDDEEIDIKECLLYPVNSLPKTRIKLKNGYFTQGDQNVEIVAKWGYSEKCPADIKLATTIFVAGIINYSLSTEGEVKSESIGDYSVTFKEEKQWQDFEYAKNLLNQYTRYTF